MAGGIDTVNSCQENRPGIVWIQFATTTHAAAFLDIVARYDDEPDGIYARIIGSWDGIEGSPPPWEYHAHPEDLTLVEAYIDDDDEVEYWHEGDPEFLFWMSIRFPRSDYPAVLARMVRYNESREKRGQATDAAVVGGQAGGQASALVVAGSAGEAGTVPGPSGAG